MSVVSIHVELQKKWPTYIVEVWLLPQGVVIDFPIINGIPQAPFEPVRGPVLKRRKELAMGRTTQGLSLSVQINDKEQKYYNYPAGDVECVCVDIVNVEPIEKGSSKTCTRRRACATVFDAPSSKELELAILCFKRLTIKDLNKYEAPLLAVRDFPIMPGQMIPFEHDVPVYGQVYVQCSMKLKPGPNLNGLRELGAKWWKTQQRLRDAADEKIQPYFFNPIYYPMRLSPHVPGMMMTYKRELNATEGWWLKNLRVIKSRCPNLNVKSKEFMVRLTKCWASTRPYVRDWVESEGEWSVGDDASLLEYQTANDCEDFAWFICRAHHSLCTSEFMHPDLIWVQETARKYRCFVVFGTMRDVGNTDESARADELRGDWSEGGHCYAIFLPQFEGLVFKGTRDLSIGEATVLQTPNIDDKLTPDILALQTYVTTHFPDAPYVIYEHHENFTSKFIVVHLDVITMLEWGGKAYRVKGQVHVSDFSDPSRSFELIPVDLSAFVPYVDEMMKYERPLPCMDLWDQQKLDSKKEWIKQTGFPTSGPPGPYFFIDLQELYWDEDKAVFKPYDGKFNGLKMWICADTGFLIRCTPSIP